MVLAELNVFKRTVDFLILTLENADTQQNYAREGNVLLDGLEVGAVEQDLITVYEIGARGCADVVCRAQSESAELIGRVRLEHQLCRAEIGPCLACLVRPNLGRALG